MFSLSNSSSKSLISIQGISWSKILEPSSNYFSSELLLSKSSSESFLSELVFWSQTNVFMLFSFILFSDLFIKSSWPTDYWKIT